MTYDRGRNLPETLSGPDNRAFVTALSEEFPDHLQDALHQVLRVGVLYGFNEGIGYAGQLSRPIILEQPNHEFILALANRVHEQSELLTRKAMK